MSFTIDEEKLAKDIGIVRKVIVNLRKKLARGIDYDTVDRRITYTKEGAKKIALIYGIKDAVMETEKKTDRGTSAFVTRVYEKNHGYMEAKKDDKIIVIRVRENTRFIIGMEIAPEKVVYSRGALWDFIGKLPRARGVW